MEIEKHKKITSVHQLIEFQAKIRPTSPSIVYKNIVLTYQELDDKSNQLAHFLRSKGVKSNSLIGIAVSRSPEMIICILAVLKSGCAYVPIDPQYPAEYINNILYDSNMRVIITQKAFEEKFLSIPDKIFIDFDKKTIESFPSNKLTHLSKSNDLAYVIYTSGSTGKPKGVMINHNSLLNTYFDWKKIYELNNLDIHLQMANFCFDVCAGDIIRALCSGGKLVICPKDHLLLADKLYKILVEEKITCAEFVPTILRRLLKMMELKNISLPDMRLLICGSDKWFLGEYRRLKNICKSSRIINSYGLTEATIDSTYFEENEWTKEFLSDDNIVPIGIPFPHSKIFLLDESQNITQYGNKGEIYIGGSNIARGYLNNTRLTHEKFVKFPFNIPENESYDRVFKTGDLGRYLPDGNIEILGRIDGQVKIKGIRIEINGIENTLNNHSLISESIVIADLNNEGAICLTAYIATKHIKNLTVDEIRNYLKNKIPSYMIPKNFIFMPSLPISRNGKLDRQAIKSLSILLNNKITETHSNS